MKFFKSLSQERIGEISVLLSAFMFGLFPVIIKWGNDIPPIFYAAVSVGIAAMMLMGIAFYQGSWSEIKNKNNWPLMTRVSLFIVIIPYLLGFKGIQMTSGINAAILEQTEMFFALFFACWWGGEVINKNRILGAIIMFVGTFFIVFNGSFNLNIGDLLIILSTISYPIGNIYAKKLLKHMNPTNVLLSRSLIGGFALFFISYIFEPVWQSSDQLYLLIKNYWPLFLINGIFMLGISKILWYVGLKRIEMSKATVLVMTYPVFGAFFAIFLLNEVPTIYQLAGLIITTFGVYKITHDKNTIVTSAEVG